MNKNRGSSPKNDQCFLTFFSPKGGAGFRVKTTVVSTTGQLSRTALLNFVKKLDNSGG